MRNVIQLLRAALGELKEDGWMQGDFHGGPIESSPHCAVGGLEAALQADFGDNWRYDDVAEGLFYRAQRVLDEVASERGYEEGIVALNDADGTTFGKVREAFNAAILRAKETA